MRKFIFLLTVTIWSALSFAQTQNEILAAELDAYIQSQMQQQYIPGLSACIVKEGQIIWKSAYGMSNFETNTPVTEETLFTLASISKLFTATACAQLWEGGFIDLDEDINNYLPIVVKNPNFPDKAITVRQLLNHKSSLRDYESDLELWDNIGDPTMSLSDFCNDYFTIDGSLYLASNFANTAPGLSTYWYSNAGFTLLGYIVEAVSGKSFNQYCKDNILTPLNMSKSAWFYSNLDINNVAMPYNMSYEAYGYFSVPEYPAAMLKSNILELSNFLIAYTQNGVFQDNTLFNTTTFASIVPVNMTNGFGWWGMDTWYGDNSGNYWSHGGYMNGVRTQLNYYPGNKTGLIILTNSEANYSAIQSKIESYIPLFQTDNSTLILETEYSSFNVFPNPTSKQNNLRIEFTEDIKQTKLVELYNIKGSIVKSIETNEGFCVIDISGCNKGTYILNVTVNNKVATEKIIIN